MYTAVTTVAQISMSWAETTKVPKPTFLTMRSVISLKVGGVDGGESLLLALALIPHERNSWPMADTHASAARTLILLYCTKLMSPKHIIAPDSWLWPAIEWGTDQWHLRGPPAHLSSGICVCVDIWYRYIVGLQGCSLGALTHAHARSFGGEARNSGLSQSLLN